MAFVANYTFSQGTDCTKFTITDSSTGYQGTELSIVSQAVPASPAYSRIRFQFITGLVTGGVYVKLVTIANNDTAAQVHTKIAAAFTADAIINALFTTTDLTTSVSVVAKKDYIYTELSVEVDAAGDFPSVVVTETQVAAPQADTRVINLTYPNGDAEVVPFPFTDGVGDSVDITITKDYALLAQMIVDGTEEFEITKPIIAVCNTDTYIRELGVEFDNKVDNKECSECLREKWSTIYDYRVQAVTQASVERIQAAQDFLDLATELYNEDECKCCK